MLKRSCSKPPLAATTPPANIPQAMAVIGCYPQPPRPIGTRPDRRTRGTGSTMTAGGGDVRADKRRNIPGCSRARSLLQLSRTFLHKPALLLALLQDGGYIGQ